MVMQDRETVFNNFFRGLGIVGAKVFMAVWKIN